MDHPNGHGEGIIGLILNISFGFLCWISAQSFQIGVSIFTGLVSACGGVMAIRYYYYATKEKKRLLKQK